MPFIAPIIDAVVAIGAAISSFVAGVGVVGQGIILAGIGVASTYLISALTPKPQTDTSASTPGGVNFQRTYGANQSRQVACGLVGVAGQDAYVNTYSTANGLLQQIYVLSDYYSTALTRVSINGVYVTLGADDGVNGQPVLTGGDFAQNPPLIWIKFFDGRQTTPDALLVANANPVGHWTDANIGLGMSYVRVVMQYDQNNNSSFPNFFFEFQGAPLYDFRKDDTVGGSGSHRWGDFTTHEFSENPILIEYNYRRGFSVNDDLFCGMDMPPSNLPLDKFTTAANICDESQDDGGVLYICSILLDCMTIHSTNLQSISLSCGSMQIDSVEGSWPLVGSDQSAVFTFTDADIVSLADFKYTAKQSMSTLVNSVSGNYPNPDQFWSMVGYDPQVATDFLAIDRRTRDVSIDFPQVRVLRQADQLAWIYLFENRFEITAQLTLRPRFQTAEAGDWCIWNSARYGMNTFIVTGTQLYSMDNASYGPRNIALSLQQRDGSIYDGITPGVPVFPFPAGDPQYLSEVENFGLIAVSVLGANGVAQAAIRVSWAPIEDVTVTQVDIMYYPVGDPTSIIHKIVTADVTVAIVAEGVVGSTLYNVQAKIITNPLRTTVFNAGKTVTTLANVYTLANFDAGVHYQVTTLLNNYSDRLDAMEQLIASTASNANARQYTNKQMVQRQLSSVNGSLSASITEVMTIASDTESEFASYQLTVATQFDTLSGSITTTETSLTTLTTSYNTFVVDVNATLGTQSADISSNLTAIATISGQLVASWSLTLSVDGHISGLKDLNDGTTSAFVIATDVFQIASPAAFGNAAQTVFTLQTVAGVTQMALRGDFIADGTITARVMNIGTLSAITGNVGTLTAGTLASTSGNFLIDLDNQRIIISS